MANGYATEQSAKDRYVRYNSNKRRGQDNIVQVHLFAGYRLSWRCHSIFAPAQEARSMIQHLKTIKDSERANQTPDQASKVIERLITAYSRSCDDAARSEKVSTSAIADLYLIMLRSESERERENIDQ